MIIEFYPECGLEGKLCEPRNSKTNIFLLKKDHDATA